jgi:hypothetical protein
MAGDLGTAHGKIRVDADTKGVGKAERDLKLFDKALELVGRAAKQFESGLNKMERELQTASRDMREADRAASGLDKSIGGADRATLSWTESLKGLHSRLKGVNQTAQDLGPSLAQIGKIGLEFRKTEGGVLGFAQAFTRAGAASTIISTLTSKFLGLGAAMATLPAGQKKIVQFANSFRLITFTIGLLTALSAKTQIFGKLYESVFRKVVKHSELGGKAFMEMEKRLKPFGPSLQKAVRYVSELNQQVDKIPAGAVRAIVGFAAMQNGLRGLAARFAFISRLSPKVMAIVGTAFASLPALVQAGAASLRGFSNALVLVLDGVKQLAGGFLAIPGGIAMMITAIGTLKVLFGGLKKAFEDVFKAKNAEELAAAIDALPEHLKPLGKVLGEIIPQWKALATDMQKTFVIGAETQLKALSDHILPAVHNGVLPLVNAFRQVKDEIVGFAAQGESISFIKQAFLNTTQTVLNLKDAIPPLLSGLRDIASVGMTFIRDLSGGASTLTEKFAEWARVNKENGNLMRWMKEAVQGVKDLWNGLKDAAKALWSLLTLFQTDTGDNAIARFADAMKKFNDAVQKSKAGGVLKQIGDAVKQMGTDKIAQLFDVFKSLGEALKDIIPFVMDVSKAFGEVFFPALKLTIKIIEEIVAVLNEFGGGEFIGTVLGLVAAWKTLAIVLGPLRNIIQTIWGAFQFGKGAQTLILGVVGTLEKFGPAGKKAGDAIMGIGDKITAAFGAIGIAAAVGLAFKEFYDAGAEQIDNMKAKVTELDQFTENMGHEIATQIVDEGTLKNSVNIFSNTIDEMRTKLQETADAAPGLAAKFTDAIRASGEGRIAGARFQAPGPEHTQEFTNLEKAAEDAKKADEAIDHLGLTTEQLNQRVTGTAEGFAQFKASLEASGEGGRIAAEHFQKLRDEWEALQRAGEGGVQIAHGIDEIASSAGDATSKLEGLKTALEGAGLLKTTQLDAAFAYSEAIREIGNAAKTSADQTQPFNDIIDAQTGSYNTASVNAQNLHNDLSKLEGDYIRAVASGEDATAAWEKQGPALENLAKQYNLPIEKVKELAAVEGGRPKEISLLLSVEGADEVKQDAVAAILAAQSAAKDQPVTIPIEGDVDQAKQAIEELLGPGSVIAQTDGTVTIKANVDKGAINNAIAVLAAHNIHVEGGPEAAPATIQVAPQVDRRGLKPVEVPVAPITPEQDTSKKIEAGPTGLPAPKVAVSPGDQATLDQAKTTIDEITKKTDELNQKKIEIKVQADALNNLTKSIDQIITSLSEKELKLSVKLEGIDAFTQGMDTIKVAISTSMAQWNNYKIAVVQAFRDIVAAFSAAMAELTQKMESAGANNKAAGQAFGNDFAQGIRDSIPAIAAAASDAAAAAADRMPGSPAKKGPLSGRGWSGYGGRAFAEDFAQGIADATGAVGISSDAMAERATKSMAGRDESFNNFLSGILRILDIASTAIGIVQSTFDHISEGFKIITDLMKPPEPKEGEKAAAAAEPGAKPGAPATSKEFDKAVLAQVKAGHYSQTGNADLTKGLGDCSSAVEDLVNIMDKKPTGGRQMATGNAAAWLTARGFKKGAGGPGDMRVAFNVQHMQATLPGGTNFNWGSEAAAAAGGLAKNLGAADPALTEKYYRTAVSGDQANMFADEVSSQDLSVYDKEAVVNDTLNTKDLSSDNQDIIKTLRSGNKELDEAIKTGEDPTKTNEEQLQALNSIDKEIANLSQTNTDDSRKQVGALEALKGTVAAGQTPDMEAGKTPLQNATDMMSSITDIASGAMSIAQDIIGVIKTTIETIGMVKASADLLVRGVENTEDLNTFIDTIQKFIELAAKVAQTVSDVTGMIAGIMGKAGGADFGASAALQAVSAIAGLISGILTTVNAAIDMAQEAWHIFGSYFGQFLGFLAGAGDQLEGDVKFLLDQNDKTLKAYSRNAPQDKASHPYGQEVGGFLNNERAQQQPQIGSITVFGGPNQDPRETTRNMMFAVKTATMGSTYAQ